MQQRRHQRAQVPTRLSVYQHDQTGHQDQKVLFMMFRTRQDNYFSTVRRLLGRKHHIRTKAIQSHYREYGSKMTGRPL